MKNHQKFPKYPKLQAMTKLQFLTNLRRIGTRVPMFISGSFEPLLFSSERNHFTLWNFCFQKIQSFKRKEDYQKTQQDIITPGFISKRGKMILLKRTKYFDCELYSIIIVDPITLKSQTVILNYDKQYGNSREAALQISHLFEGPEGCISFVCETGLIIFDINTGNLLHKFSVYNNLYARCYFDSHPIYISDTQINIYMKYKTTLQVRLYDLKKNLSSTDLSIVSKEEIFKDWNNFSRRNPMIGDNIQNIVSTPGSMATSLCLFDNNQKLAIGNDTVLSIYYVNGALPKTLFIGKVDLNGHIIQICAISKNLLITYCLRPKIIYIINALICSVCCSFRPAGSFFTAFQTIP